MKVFMLIKKLRYSGAYKMFMWVAKVLADRGHQVTVMTFMSNDVNELPTNIKWIKADELEHKNIFFKIAGIRKVIQRGCPDVSISFLLDANVYNIFACLGLKTKSVVCERNDPFKPGYRVLKFWLPCFRLADGAVFQLDKVAEYYHNIKRPTAVIPNPVLSRTDLVLQPFLMRSNRICVLGRLDIFQKRHDLLIAAFALFHKKYPEYSLHFYGDGPDEMKMKQQALELGIEDCVFFDGITDEPQMVMAHSKMYVLTSDFEGIPNALIEAMSLGLPCISTDCRPGGAALLINNGQNGFLVPVRDSQAIAEKMIFYVENPQTADAMGLEAKKIAMRFSESRITDMWEHYILSLK